MAATNSACEVRFMAETKIGAGYHHALTQKLTDLHAFLRRDK